MRGTATPHGNMLSAWPPVSLRMLIASFMRGPGK